MNVYDFLNDGDPTQAETKAPAQEVAKPAYTVPPTIDFKTATPEQLAQYNETLRKNNAALDANTAETKGKVDNVNSYDISNSTIINPALGTGKGSKSSKSTPATPSPYDGMMENTPQVDPTQGSDTINTNTRKIIDILGMTTPKFDDQKAERLKKISAINAVGQALSTAFGGYIGAKGGPILDTRTDITPKALAEYQAMVEKDKDNKYKTAMMQAQEAINGIREVSQNELKNKQYNQEQKAKTFGMKSKFNLDAYAKSEEHRYRLDEQTAKFGFTMDELLQKNGYDVDKAKLEAENRLKIAQLQQGGENARNNARIAESKRLYPNGKPVSGQYSLGIPNGISFKPNGFGDDVTLTENQVGAMLAASDNDPNQSVAIKKVKALALTNGKYSHDALTQILPLLWADYAGKTQYGQATPDTTTTDPDADLLAQ